MRAEGGWGWRWIPAAFMIAVSLISYIDRNTLALLAPTILQETRLSGEQYGFIISPFSVALNLTDAVEAEPIFQALAENGVVKMPLQYAGEPLRDHRFDRTRSGTPSRA